jgi:hypothetical protein
MRFLDGIERLLLALFGRIKNDRWRGSGRRFFGWFLIMDNIIVVSFGPSFFHHGDLGVGMIPCLYC